MKQLKDANLKTRNSADYLVNNNQVDILLSKIADGQDIEESIAKLVELNVYAKTQFMDSSGLTASDMVRLFGADWHVFRQPHTCPKCGFDLCNTIAGPPFKFEIIKRRLHIEYVECPNCNEVL